MDSLFINCHVLGLLFTICIIIYIKRKRKTTPIPTHSNITSSKIDQLEKDNPLKYLYLNDLATGGYISDDVIIVKSEIMTNMIDTFTIFLELSLKLLETFQKFQKYLIIFKNDLSELNIDNKDEKTIIIDKLHTMLDTTEKLVKVDKELFNKLIIQNPKATTNETKSIDPELVKCYIGIVNSYSIFVEAYLSEYVEVRTKLENIDMPIYELFVIANNRFVSVLFMIINVYIYRINNSISIYS